MSVIQTQTDRMLAQRDTSLWPQYVNMLKMLKGHGVEQIESLGQPFDPHLHQAMMQEQAPDQPPNTVIREIHKGYRMNERILRVASVIVSATQESTEDGKPASPGA